MNKPAPLPIARPIHSLPVAKPPAAKETEMVVAVPMPPVPVSGALATPQTDHLAVVSAVCGLTGVIPLVAQVLGLVLGFVSLQRIRRAKRAGIILKGRIWAITGMVSSGIGLLGWIAMGASMALLGSSLAHSVAGLTTIAPGP